MAKTKQSLFQYIVLQHEVDDEKETVESTLIVDVTNVLASTEDKAAMMAARSIPDGVDLDTVEVVVRPF